jgi:hypothetical protein
MKARIATVGLGFGLAALAFQAADAAVLNGRISRTANTCPTAIGAINGDDCSYNNSFTEPDVDPWVGPDRSSGFYASTLANGNWVTEPTPGDGKVAPPVQANLTIGGGNVVSGTIVIGPVAINNFSAGPGGRGEDSWTSATITLAPKAADSINGNVFVIGSAGYPPYLQAANASDHFPSETGADSNNSSIGPDVLWWAGPAAIGITNVEGNTGTTGSMPNAAVVGWTCNDVDGNPSTGACASASSFRGRVDFENILLRITTDGANNPVAVEGFLVQGGAGVANPFTTPNWVAWTFKASIDTDGDSVPNHLDNCSGTSNVTQLDANSDGYGNICDADLNNSNLTTSTDFNLLRSVLNQSSGASALAAAADMNGSGLVTSTDFNLLRARLNTVPGQSGLPCAGTIPCTSGVQQP